MCPPEVCAPEVCPAEVCLLEARPPQVYLDVRMLPSPGIPDIDPFLEPLEVLLVRHSAYFT
jgi:hypothetical protein